MTDINWEQILEDLEYGKTRAATKVNGEWVVNIVVKQAILMAFKAGKNIELPGGFVDKHTITPQVLTNEHGVRVVPGGTSIRKGAYLAPSVIVMPPSYVNVGAYVDTGTMIDSHVLVGSCAQVGKNVHLSAGVQIGGVLEPVGQVPVVIEDNVFIGAGSIIVEGILVKTRAIIAPGVILSRGVSIYDMVNEKVLERGAPVPENAVVVPGVRKITGSSEWSDKMGLHLSCPVIVKYRDEKTDTSVVLEQILR